MFFLFSIISGVPSFPPCTSRLHIYMSAFDLTYISWRLNDANIRISRTIRFSI